MSGSIYSQIKETLIGRIKKVELMSVLIQNNSQSNQQLLFRRKLAVVSVVLVTFVFLLLFNLGSYFFIKRMGTHLENALDARLVTAASLATQIIEKDLTNLYDPREHSLISNLLTQIHSGNDFEAVYIIDKTFNTLVDSRIVLEMTKRGYLREDSTEIQLALNGTITASQLHTIAGNHFKSVYAPVIDFDGNTAVLVLEANAEFLDIIHFFRRGLYIGSATSLFLLVFLTIYVIWAMRLFLRTEAQLQQSQRLAAMGQIGATMAHEIRNPLGIIKSTSDVLREKYQNRGEPDELFGYINDEIRRLNRLVNDFLSLSREPVLNVDEHNLTQLIKRAVQSFDAENRGQTKINVDAPDELLVSCDTDLLHQVILNLFLNSAQATEKLDIEIQVCLSIAKVRAKKFAKIEIADNGVGFADDQQKIFEPFYTTKAKGTGLGLAVSRSIIEKHGGWIEAENGKQGGAMIRFFLPLEK